MKVSYSSAENKVVEIYAAGNVRAHNNEKAIFSQEATYSANEGRITFTGSPKVVDGENIITGGKIVYFIKDDRAVVEDSRVILEEQSKRGIMHSLEITELKKSYNGKTIVSDVSMNISSGEVVGLLARMEQGRPLLFT